MSALLGGQCALITGGGRGIGRAIAMRFADAGANVFLTGRTERELQKTCEDIRAGGGAAKYAVVDLQEDAAAGQAAAQALDAYGRIDILVNNAGKSQEMPLVDMPMEVWDDLISINLRAVTLCIKAVLPHMIANASGNIINIASASAIRGLPGSTAYTAAKAAVVGLGQALGDEVRPQGIRVNSICPGPVDTELFQKSERRDFILAAGGDVFQPETIANAALFLASDLSRGMNSQVITMRGINRW